MMHFVNYLKRHFETDTTAVAACSQRGLPILIFKDSQTPDPILISQWQDVFGDDGLYTVLDDEGKSHIHRLGDG